MSNKNLLSSSVFWQKNGKLYCYVKIYPNSRQNKISEEENMLKIYVTELPEKGKANQALIRILSKYYHISKTNINIIQGEKNRIKLLQINLN